MQTTTDARTTPPAGRVRALLAAGSGPRRRRAPALVALGAVALAGLLSACLPTEPGTERVSVDAGGAQLPNPSFHPDLSRDGRYVVFSTNLPSDPTDPQGSLYRKDRASGALELVSVDDAGVALPGRHVDASISADGTRVAFTQHLRVGPTAIPVVLVRDLSAGRTIQASVSTSGAVTQGAAPEISSDGRFVTFTSDSATIVAGDTNGASDVFVRDLEQGVTRRVSVTNGGGQLADGAEGSSISGDGRFVAFNTTANLSGADTDNTQDIYVRDTVANTTAYESISGSQSRSAPFMDLSDDGRMLVFSSQSGSSLQQVWVRDRASRQLRLITFSVAEGAPGDHDSWEVAISRDGGHVAFSSRAGNLAGGSPRGQLHVYVATSTGADLTRVSVDDAGVLALGDSSHPAVNDGGTTVAFGAFGSNLVPGDTNSVSDVFVKRR